jgi:hypothetical protein
MYKHNGEEYETNREIRQKQTETTSILEKNKKEDRHAEVKTTIWARQYPLRHGLK